MLALGSERAGGDCRVCRFDLLKLLSEAFVCLGTVTEVQSELTKVVMTGFATGSASLEKDRFSVRPFRPSPPSVSELTEATIEELSAEEVIGLNLVLQKMSLMSYF